MLIDADFARHKEPGHFHDHVLFRTGYIMLFSNRPISQASELQTEVSLSTTKTKYIALSTATRNLLFYGIS
jgi:hypothetical protein